MPAQASAFGQGEQLTPQQFAGRLRTKYPGQYDDLSDDDLTNKVVAKYPEYRDMVKQATKQPGPGQTQVEQEGKPAFPGSGLLREAALGAASGGLGIKETTDRGEAAMSAIPQPVKDVARFGPAGLLKSIYETGRGIYTAVKSQVGRGVEDFAKPGILNKVAGVGHLALAVNPALASAGGGEANELEDAARQRDPEMAAHAVGSLAGKGAGVAMATTETGRGMANKAIEKAGGVLPGAIERLGDMATPEPHQALVKALKPPNTKPQFAQSMQSAGPDVQAAAQASGEKVGDIGSLIQHTQGAKKSVWQEYEDLRGPHQQELIDGNPIADRMVGTIDKRMRTQNPEQAARIEKTADTYRRDLTLAETEDFLQSANNELASYYAKNKVGRAQAARDPQVGNVVAEADALRDGLYSKLDQLAGPGARELKQRYGALSDLEGVALKRKVVYDRQVPIGLTETLGRIAGTGQVVRGMLGGGPGDIMAGAAQMGIGKYIRDMNDTNKLIDGAFNGRKAFKARTPGAQGTVVPPAGARGPAGPAGKPLAPAIPGGALPAAQTGRPLLQQGPRRPLLPE